MKHMDEKTIRELVNEAITGLGMERIYDEALPYVDFEALKAAQPINQTDLCATFAVAGFSAGIEFALRNIEISDDGKEKDI